MTIPVLHLKLDFMIIEPHLQYKNLMYVEDLTKYVQIYLILFIFISTSVRAYNSRNLCTWF